jgi:DNA-3-methyladenine glycosylase
METKMSRITQMSNGPGKLCAALGISMTSNCLDLCSPNNDELFIEEVDGETINDECVGISERINIDYAGEYVSKPWRFYIKSNPYVSK